MTNHPNRSRAKSPASNPTVEEIKAARAAAGLTQKQSGELILGTSRAWEQYEIGNRRMHPGLWELFLIKTGQKTLPQSIINQVFSSNLESYQPPD